MKTIQAVVKLCALLLVVGQVTACGGTAPSEQRLRQPTGGADAELSQGKVTICHIPPGNPANEHTISVGQSAVKAHLAHGDSLQACGSLTCLGEDEGPCASSRDCCSGLTCDADSLCNP